MPGSQEGRVIFRPEGPGKDWMGLICSAGVESRLRQVGDKWREEVRKVFPAKESPTRHKERGVSWLTWKS